MTRGNSPYDFIGAYGPDWERGIISEHLPRFEKVGGRVHTLASGREIAVLPDGTTAPIVCSHLIWINTEDGRVDGRCGAPVAKGRWACPGHAAEMDEWRAMTEAEKLHWEQARDREDV